MNPTIFTSRIVRRVRIGVGCCLLLVISLSVAYSQRFEPMKSQDKAFPNPFQSSPSGIAKLPVEPGAVEIAFTDGSNLKMVIREEKIALDTPHGKLLIAVADIQRIEFATRVSEEDGKRIQTAIHDLGSSEFSKREAASTELLKLREKGYPEIVRAAEQKDLEVARRARELIQQIAANVPAEQLTVRPKDVVYTADSMITGRIEAASLKAHTSQFGAVKLRLADARGLRSQALESPSNAVNPYSSGMPMPSMPKPGFRGALPRPDGGGFIPKGVWRGGKGGAGPVRDKDAKERMKMAPVG